MGSKAKAPKAPDYTALANQQAQLQNQQLQQQTVANRPNQINSSGSLTWSQDPTSGQWTQTTTLSPELQAAQQNAYQLQARQMQQVNDLMNRGPFQGGPAMPTYNPTGVQAGQMPQYQNNAGAIGDFQNAAGDIADYQNNAGGVADYQNNAGSIQDFLGGQINRQNMPQYDQASGEQYAQRFTENLLGRVRPQQQIDQQQMASKLRLQGLQPGTAAYDRAYKNLLNSQGDVNAQASLQGLLAGGQEARNIYNTQLGGQQQDFSQLQGMAENERANYGLNLQGQGQRWNQGVGDYQAQLAGQGQRHGQGIADYQAGLAGQQQRFGQGLQGYEANLAGQGQRWNQGVGDYQAQLAGQDQNFQQQLGSANNARADYQSQLGGQQQGYQQAMEQYLMPYQTASLAQGLAGNVSQPNFESFMGAGMGEAPQVMDAAQQQYAQQMQAYNEKQQQRSGKLGSIGGLAGAAFGAFGGPAGAKIGTTLGSSLGSSLGSAFSDEALKDDIAPLDDEEAYNVMLALLPVSWKWKGAPIPDAGVSAQQLLEILPELVRKGEHGHLMVNYSALFGILLGAFRHMAAKEKANG